MKVDELRDVIGPKVEGSSFRVVQVQTDITWAAIWQQGQDLGHNAKAEGTSLLLEFDGWAVRLFQSDNVSQLDERQRLLAA